MTEMRPIDYTVHISFYEVDTERMLGFREHPHPPAVGDLVHLTIYNDDGTPEFGTFRVTKRAWHYTGEGSTNWIAGNRGGILDVMVERAAGLFRPGPEA